MSNPLWVGPESPDQGRPSYTSRKSSTSKERWTRKSLEESSAPQVSCCWGSHLQPPLWDSPRRRRTCSLNITFMWGLGLLRKGNAMRERVPRQEPWALSSSTFHWKLPLRTPLSLGLFSPQATLAERGKVLPPCGRILELQASERSFWAL